MVKIPIDENYEIIKWQLRYLSEHTECLRENQIELLISFETQFEKYGKLSPRQMEVLEDIYKKCDE